MNYSDTVVLIPHFNNPSGLLNSLKSIREPFPIDVVIVDDGSEYQKIDEQVFRNELDENISLYFYFLKENKGIEHALNYGLDIIRERNYNYIARLDCGDTCEINRFKIQRDFLIENPHIKLVGTFVSFFYPDHTLAYKLELPTDDNEIRKKMFQNSMFIHPTVMFHKEIFDKVPQYPTEFIAAEDYAYFFEIIKYYKAANINRYLVNCELNPSGISITKRKTQVKSRIKIIKANFDYSFYAFYGLQRNYLILFMPHSIFSVLKRLLVK